MSSCCKYFTAFVIICFIIFGLPWIIYYQVVKPRNPTFTIDHASVSGFNLTSDGHLTSFFDIGLKADNRNHKLKLKYRRIRVSIFKDKQNLGTDSFPGFTQRKHNVTIVRVQPVSINVALKKGPAFDFGVENGMGYIKFDVFMTAYMNAQNLEVDCKNVTVNVMSAHSTSNMTQNLPTCSVLVYSNDPTV